MSLKQSKKHFVNGYRLAEDMKVDYKRVNDIAGFWIKRKYSGKSKCDMQYMQAQVVYDLYEKDLKNYDESKGELYNYLYSCAELRAENARNINHDSMGESDTQFRLRMKINADIKNGMGKEEIKSKYGIKKDSTLHHYTDWNGRAESLDKTDDDGNSLYSRISDKSSKNISKKSMYPDLSMLNEKEQCIVLVYIDFVRKDGHKRGCQSKTVELCQKKYGWSKKDIVDAIHKYQNSSKEGRPPLLYTHD